MPRDLFEEDNGTDLFSDLSEKKGSNLPGKSRIPSMLDRLPLQGMIPEGVRQFGKDLPADLLAGGSELITKLLNAPHNEWSMLAPAIGKYIPHIEQQNYADKLGIPETGANKLVQSLAANAPFLAAPEAKLGQAGEVIGSIPKVGGFLSQALKSAIPQAAIGSALSEDPIQGGLKSGGIQLGLEALTSPLKGIKSIAEIFNPVEAAQTELGNIRNAYQKSEAAKNEAYQPFNVIAKDYKIENPKNYIESRENNFDYFGPELKKLDKRFQKNPTLENAHKLQSEMFTRIKNESKKLDPNYNTIEALDHTRNAINKDLYSKLFKIDKDVASKYREGAEIHREQVAPYFSNSNLAKLVEGDIDEISPQDIISAIKPAKESKKIPQDHYLREALSNMKSKTRQSAAARYALPSIAATIGSQLLHPGLGSALGGMTVGAITGAVTPKITEDIIQNPEVAKLFQKLRPSKDVGSASSGMLRELLNQLF